MTKEQIQAEVQRRAKYHAWATKGVDEVEAFKAGAAAMQEILGERERELVSVLKQVNIPCNHRYSGDCDGCNSEILIWNTLRKLGYSESEGGKGV